MWCVVFGNVCVCAGDDFLVFSFVRGNENLLSVSLGFSSRFGFAYLIDIGRRWRFQQQSFQQLIRVPSLSRLPVPIDSLLLSAIGDGLSPGLQAIRRGQFKIVRLSVGLKVKISEIILISRKASEKPSLFSVPNSKLIDIQLKGKTWPHCD